MKQQFLIRDAAEAEVPMIQGMFADARAYMRQNGNLNQWTGGYPSDETLKNDIQNHALKLCLLDGEPAAVFALCGIEPTYARIEGGAWLNDAPYLTVHRIACVKRGHGVSSYCLDYAKRLSDNVRADTHRDNLPMQALLQKNGFRYCGIIYLQDGAQRLAYHWTRGEECP